MEKVVANGILVGGHVLVSHPDEASALHGRGNFGETKKSGKPQLSII